jgi:sigma-B regulation protein RsbQ
VAVGQYVARALPHAELAVLEATGHCPNLSAPEETVAAMAPFVRRDVPLPRQASTRS